MVSVGSRVLIRSVRSEEWSRAPFPLSGDDESEVVLAIVEPRDVGLHRLSVRTPLGRALLGRQAGDMVEVVVQAGTAKYELLAVF